MSFVLYVFSDIIFDKVVGYENTANVVRREVVGESKLRSPIASVPRFLVTIIFNMKPINFPANPPNNSISVDFTNAFSFILLIIINYMF